MWPVTLSKGGDPPMAALRRMHIAGTIGAVVAVTVGVLLSTKGVRFAVLPMAVIFGWAQITGL